MNKQYCVNNVNQQLVMYTNYVWMYKATKATRKPVRTHIRCEESSEDNTLSPKLLQAIQFAEEKSTTSCYCRETMHFL